jgi:penicillin-binding protein 1A
MTNNTNGRRPDGPRISFDNGRTEAESDVYRRTSSTQQTQSVQRKPYRAEKTERSRLSRCIRWFFRLMFSRVMLGIYGSVLLTGMILGSIGLIYYARLLPDISGLAAAKEQAGVEITAEDGTLVARYGQISGQYIPYANLPKHLIDAVIATEDRRFFSHMGVDPWGVLRAMVVNVRTGNMTQGGSTVTQQLAKNLFLSSERTMSRKIQELMMSFWLEQKFTKEEIIAIYLNRVYFGGGSYGVDAASRYYFDKSVGNMDLVECAMLAGLLKAPSRYNPTSSTTLAVGRTEQVLRNMIDAEKITEAEGEAAIAELKGGNTHFKKQAHDNARYFSDWILEQLPEYIGEPTEDIVIATTLNPLWQQQAEAAIAAQMTPETRKANKVDEVAMLAMRPNGAIVSMMGGRDYNLSQYNRATQAKRQPGSAFKLFVYLAAMEHGYFPLMKMIDEPVTIGNWHPENYKEEYRGEVTIQEALALSLNTVSVRLSQRVGIGAVRNVAKRLGIKSTMSALPSLALGALEVSLQEMVTAYAHLANHGKAVKPYGIVEIRRKSDNKVLYTRTERDDFSDVTVVKEDDVMKMNAMLSAVVGYGTGKAAAIGRSAAGKTGTTSDYKDAWFIGYTPNLVTGVWVGNDNAKATAKVTGGGIPARIWQGYMKAALADIPPTDLPQYYKPQVVEEPILPWLQGGETGEEGEGIPANAPAGYVPSAPLAPNAGDGTVAPYTPSSPPPSTSYQLEKSFWNKLMDDDKVEYDYPSPRN